MATAKKSAKSAVKRPSATATKGSAAKKSAGRKYSPAASEQVARELHEMHEGKLTIGRSDKKVINRSRPLRSD